MATDIDIKVGALVAGAVTTWAIHRFHAGASRSGGERAPDGSVTLRYPPVVRVLGVLFVAFALGAAVVAYQFPVPSVRMPWAMIAAFVGATGGWLAAAGWRERLVVGPDGVRQHTRWGTVRELAWNDVRSVGLLYDGYLTLRGPGGTVRVSTLMVGTGDLWRAIEANLPEALWAEARRRSGGRAPTV